MRSNANWIFVAAVFGFACGGGARPESTSFPEMPLATLSGEAGKLVVEVRTAPDQPPERGIDAVQVVVKDSSGTLQDGLQIAATLWMPAMGHGSSVDPTATARGKGTYVLDNVYLYMPGLWELRTSFSGSVTDRAAPAFDVP
jgi:hypothetical protein